MQPKIVEDTLNLRFIEQITIPALDGKFVPKERFNLARQPDEGKMVSFHIGGGNPYDMYKEHILSTKSFSGIPEIKINHFRLKTECELLSTVDLMKELKISDDPKRFQRLSTKEETQYKQWWLANQHSVQIKMPKFKLFTLCLDSKIRVADASYYSGVFSLTSSEPTGSIYDVDGWSILCKALF